MKKSARKMLTAAITLVGAVAMASQAHAATLITYQLQVDPSNAGYVSGTAASVTAGQTVTLDVYADLAAAGSVTIGTVIFNSNATGGVYQNAGFVGSFASSGLSQAGTAANPPVTWGTTTTTTSGDFLASVLSPVTGTNIQLGTIQYVVNPAAANGTTATLSLAIPTRASGKNYDTYVSGSTSVGSNSQVVASTESTGSAVVLSLPPGGPTYGITLTNSGTATNGDTVTVTPGGGAGKYLGHVLTLGTPLNTGTIAISGTPGGIGSQGDTAGPVNVLLWLTGDTAANIKAGFNALNQTGVTAYISGDAVPSDVATLMSTYSALNPSLSGDALVLVRFATNPAVSGNAYSDFLNFQLPAGDNLAAITAVPEPASLGLLALGGLGLLARRRSSKK